MTYGFGSWAYRQVSVFEGVPELRHDWLVSGIVHVLGVPSHHSYLHFFFTQDDEEAPGSESGGVVVGIQDSLELGVEGFPGSENPGLEGCHGVRISQGCFLGEF